MSDYSSVERKAALFEVYKDRCEQVESALQKILLVTDDEHRRNRDVIPLVRGICEDAGLKSLAIFEDFYRRFPPE
jgi:hypothetical protein